METIKNSICFLGSKKSLTAKTIANIGFFAHYDNYNNNVF